MTLARLVTCDVVQPDLARLPRVTQLGVPCASVIGDGGPGDPGWCLALASSNAELALLDGDPAVTKVFPIPDMERDQLLLMTKQSPDELGWTAEQVAYIHERITERGGTVDDLPPSDAPLFVFLTAISTLLGQPEADARQLWAE
jgi:hypothetical protein